MITKQTYFNRLYKTVFPEGNSVEPVRSYRKVCKVMFNTPFRYSIYLDKNRFEDGLSYRYRLGFESTEPCNVFEMLVALAVRMEEDIMSDPRFGDRIPQWFFSMIGSMGLAQYDDKVFDEEKVENLIETFLNRKYAKNGKGGLFTFRHKTILDPREVEIWDQMQWWLGMYH